MCFSGRRDLRPPQPHRHQYSQTTPFWQRADGSARTAQRIGFEFPFLDFLDDGHTSFRWAPVQLITESNDIAVNGSRHYGTVVHPAQFDPPCNGYKELPNGASYLEGYSRSSGGGGGGGGGGGEDGASTTMTRVALEFERLAIQGENPYPLDFWRNITNQPNFADGSVCGNMKRFFNTELSRGQYEPVFVKGKVQSSGMGPFKGNIEWSDVYGVQLDTPFIEICFLTCDWLEGYSGFDEPDIDDFRANLVVQ